MASRARTQFETALGALLVARTGQEACPYLGSILDGWDGELTVLLRKRINRHIENCAICDERKRRELSPAALLSLLPVALLPVGLRRELFRLVADRSPVAAEHRDLVLQRAGPWRPDGFPAPAGGLPPVRRTFSRTALLTGAAAVAVLLLGGGAVFAADLLGHSSPGRPRWPPPRPAAAPALARWAPDRPARARPASTTGPPRARRPAPRPRVLSQPAATSPAAARSATPSPSASRSRSASPSPSASPTPPPSPGTLTASTTRVALSSAGRRRPVLRVVHADRERRPGEVQPHGPGTGQ